MSMFGLFLDPNTKLQNQIFQAKILKHFANAPNQSKVSFCGSRAELFAGCCSAGQKWVIFLPQDDKQHSVQVSTGQAQASTASANMLWASTRFNSSDLE